MKVFKDYALYYNAFYQDKDYAAEAGQVDMLLKKYGKSVRTVMNFGCGTGRHDMELSRLGYECSGIDMSSLMIDIAKKNTGYGQAEINFAVADIRNYHPAETYDAVISLFHVMSYQNGDEDILSAFGSARKILDKGGLFLFDVWYGPGVLSDKPAVRVKEADSGGYRLVRIARPVMHNESNIVDVCYEVLVINQETNEVKTINEVHNMRYFFRPELEFYLKETGFELIDNLDCGTLGKTDYNTWTSYFVARAV